MFFLAGSRRQKGEISCRCIPPISGTVFLILHCKLGTLDTCADCSAILCGGVSTLVHVAQLRAALLWRSKFPLYT